MTSPSSKIVNLDFGGTSAPVMDSQSSVVPDITKPVFSKEELDPKNWDTYRDHDGNEFKVNPEFRHLIPSLEEDELEELEVQLKAFGCREPLVTWRGMLLDGHNRLEICKENTIPFKTVSYDDKISSIYSARIWIRGNQKGRRNVNNFIKVQWALDDRADFAAEARENQGKRNDLKDNVKDFAPNLGQRSSDDRSGRTDRKIAEAAGVSHGTVHKVTKILESGNQRLINDCKDGKLSTDAAFMKLQQGKQRSEAELIGFPTNGNYDVIYCDPYMRSCGTMPGWTSKELAIGVEDLPVRKAYMYECMMFMWTPSVYLDRSLERLKKWGFHYVDTITWELTEPIENQRTHNKCVFLLIGSAGGASNYSNYKPLTLVKHNLAHEGKRYEQAREVIEKMFPDEDTKKLEMFANQEKEGWDLFTGMPVE